MTGSAQHQLAKWLATVLQPVLSLYFSHCLPDSFSFANIIKNCNLVPSSIFMCSFDISSLFTNVPLAETIEICANGLYSNNNLSSPLFPPSVFIELMELATSSIEFSFNNEMYRQIDGVAMGSPLGPALANIFVGYHEAKLFGNEDKPLMYHRYVDDTFLIFRDETQSNSFLDKLNSLHPSLLFSQEKECNQSFPFLDVLVEKNASHFLTSVYRKPTFTGRYIRWNSFSSSKRKTNLICTLTHRALAICSPEKLQPELDKIRFILLNNNYPDYIIQSSISKTITQFNKPSHFGPKKCPVYLRLPWLGSILNKSEKQIKSAIHNCFYAVEPRVVFKTNEMLAATQKDVLPTHQQSNIVYQFRCRCDSRYVGPYVTKTAGSH